MGRIVIFLLASLMATLADAGEPQYLVTFAESVEINHELVQQVARTYGAAVEDLRGNQAIVRVSHSRARQLSSDARVRTITALSTELIDWNTGVHYTYDGAGNIRQAGNDTFTYDTVGRLVQGQAAGVTRNFRYDAFGNRTACTEGGVPCQTTSHAYGASTNQSSAMLYDLAGNVTSANGHLYDYDALHMQIRDRAGTTSREYVYTAQDERIAVYNVGAWWNWTIRGPSGRILREFTSEGTGGTSNWKWTKDYIWRDELLLTTIQPASTSGTTSTYHHHLDHLGTPRRITDAFDRIVGHHDYHPFGPERPGGREEPSLTVLKYTGHERDGNDPEALDYMHARYYSAALGRFSSVDPVLNIERHLQKPQSWNRYSYVENNPMNNTDPTGRCTVTSSWFVPCVQAVQAVGKALWDGFSHTAANSGIGKLFLGAESGDVQLAMEGQAQLNHEVLTGMMVTSMMPSGGSQTVNTTLRGEAWVSAETFGARIGSRLAGHASGKMATIASEVTGAGMSQANAATAVNSAVQATGLRTTGVMQIGRDLVVGSVAPGTNRPVMVINAQGVVRQGTATIEVTNLDVLLKDLRY